MTETPDRPARSGTIGCVAGIAIVIGLPTLVFCSILIATAMNPQGGTPADSGGSEMGPAAGSIAGIIIGPGPSLRR